MIVVVVAWLVREFQQVLRGRTAGTFSNLCWVLLGARYGGRWFLLMGATAGLLSWFWGHLGWHLGPRHLGVLLLAGAAAGAAAFLAARVLL